MKKNTITKVLITIFMLLTIPFCGMSQTNPFTAGNIVVLRIGDGSAALSSAATADFLDEYTPSGTFVQSIAIPTTGLNKLVNSGTATSEGNITLSSDKHYLTLAGYDTVAGIASVTSSTVVHRKLLRVSTELNYVPMVSTTAYSGNNIRSGVYNNNNYWASGTSTGAIGGVQYFGTGTACQVSNTVTNIRAINIFNNQLYFSVGSGSSTFGIWTVGTGMPTTSGQTSTNIIATGATSSSYEFSFNATGDTCYLADDRASTLGGIYKYTKSGTVWSAAYSFPVGGLGTRGLTVDWSGTYPVIYATTANSTIVKIVDNGSAATYSTLVSAATNTAFRGLAFAPLTTHTAPMVSTKTTSNITSYTATCSGDITSNGGATILLRGICYSTSSNPDTTNLKVYSSDTSAIFSANITGLNHKTTYHYRAFAINTIGITYGADSTFSTLAIAPTITTVVASNIDAFNATVSGAITNDGGAAIIEKGICWGTNPDITIADNHITDASLTTGILGSLTGLNPSTLYYAKAYATNSAGTAYGDTISFKTLVSLITTITGSTNVCKGQSETYSVPVIINATSYSWTLPAGVVGASDSNSIVIYYSASTVSGDISFKGYDIDNNEITATLAITVNSVPLAPVATTPVTYCQNNTASELTATGSYLLWYTTATGGTGSLVVPTPVTIVAGSTHFFVSQTVNGCESPRADITVNVNHAYNNASNTTICQGDSVVVGAHTYLATGNYIDSLKTTLDCDSIITTNLTVIQLPGTAGTITGMNPVCQGQITTYTVPTIANATSYEWTLPTGATGTSDSNSIDVNYVTSSISGNISVTGINSCGSSNTATLAITVNPLPVPTIYPQSSISESFENGGSVPPGWSTQVVSGGNTISFVTSTSWPNGYTAYDGNYLVMFNSFSASSGVNRLKKTAPISTVGMTNASVNFAWLESTAYAGVLDKVEVEYSTDGSTWTTAGTYNRYNTVQGWKNKSQSLPAGALGQASLYIAFKFTSSYGNDCYLDLVNIYTPITTCAGNTDTYSTETGMTGYTWSVSAGGTIKSGEGTHTLNVLWDTAGAQTVSVNYINSNGCSSPNVTTNITVNPSYHITSNKSICQGDSVVVGTNVYYTTGVFIDHFTTTLGCDSIITTNLTVTNLPVAAGIITGEITVCQGQSAVTYTLPAITNATTYVWTLPANATGTSDSNNIIVNYSAIASSGNITVYGTNTCGNSDTVSLAITVNTLPAYPEAITGQATFCSGGVYEKTYTVPAIIGANSYIWTLPNNITGTSDSNSINVSLNFQTASGSESISVKGSNACGNGPDASFTISVNPVYNIINYDTICQGGSVVVGTHVYTTTGAYTDNLTTTHGCDSVITTILTVKPLPVSSGVILGDTSLCQGQNGITYLTPPMNYATSYVWTLPAGAMFTNDSTGINVNYSDTAVSGYITVWGINSCGNSDTIKLHITVNPKPATPIITQIVNTLSSSSSIGNQWFTGAAMINNATSQDYMPTQIADYYVIVTINGCSSDTSNHIYYNNTGIAVNDKPSFSIYPNPNNGNFNVVFNKNMDADVKIFSAIGSLIEERTINATTTNFNISSYSKGMYMIQITDRKTGLSTTEKLIVQ